MANETPAGHNGRGHAGASAATATVAAPAAMTDAKAPLDLTQKTGEHPLMPVIRALKVSQEEIDRNMRDYSCTFVKRERVERRTGRLLRSFC